MIDSAILRSIAQRGRDPANHLARRLLETGNDPWIEGPLRDCLGEQGVESMTGLEVGKKYYVETVTKYYVGELAAIDFSGLTLANASWIPDTGRYHETFRDGSFKEVEPLPEKTPLFIPASVVTGIVEWKHALPQKAK